MGIQTVVEMQRIRAVGLRWRVVRRRMVWV
jgi:hypothetical protein